MGTAYTTLNTKSGSDFVFTGTLNSVPIYVEAYATSGMSFTGTLSSFLNYAGAPVWYSAVVPVSYPFLNALSGFRVGDNVTVSWSGSGSIMQGVTFFG